MLIKIIKDQISKKELLDIAKNQFGNMVKGVVDIEKKIMALGGELHADAEALLLENGSQQENLWGVNFYPQSPGDELIEFDSMINIRPSQGNSSRDVESLEIQRKIRDIAGKLIF